MRISYPCAVADTEGMTPPTADGAMVAPPPSPAASPPSRVALAGVPAPPAAPAPTGILDESPESGRLARWLASPASVLIVVPILVLVVGVTVLLLGRRATRDSAATMARRQLAAQAEEVERDVSFALDQAGPVLGSLRLLSDPTIPAPELAARLRDVVVARPGIAYTSLVFADGVFWGTFIDDASRELRVHRSAVTASGTTRENFTFTGGQPRVISSETSDYDPRTRPRYQHALTSRGRSWMPPRTFSSSHKTGLTVTEPVFAPDGAVRSVLTIDFDVAELSAFIGKAPLDGARTVVFTADGTVLAYPAAALPDTAIRDNRLLRYDDFADPALDALFAAVGRPGATPLAPSAAPRFEPLAARDGKYLASIAALGGRRAGSAVPVDWYLATLVPERTIMGATWRFGRQALWASALALTAALGVAVMFAWNFGRMRRAVGAARAQARSAEARARELGSYRLVERLGMGGMGEVWRAEHQLLARQAAIKLMRTETLANPRTAAVVQERFRREAQTLAALRSRHTIELYDYGVTADGSFFFVMELLDGLDLAKLVRGHGPQPAARVIAILHQACQSLAEAHDAGLYHRDIKPANLFLCRAADEVDIVKLLDFGIVHSVNDPVDARGRGVVGPAALGVSGEVTAEVTGERLTVEGTIIGTPGYIPPEILRGSPSDARGDLYALGCVAWWLLTGKEVYLGARSHEVVFAHAFAALPSLRAAVGERWLPDELERIVVSCLSKTPEQRPADARALAAALAAIDIPDPHAWAEPDARAWWRQHRPPLPTVAVAVTGGRGVVVGTGVAQAAPAPIEAEAAPVALEAPATVAARVRTTRPRPGGEA